jgi:hypothetical protein
MRKWASILAIGAVLAFAGTAGADSSQAGCQAYGEFVKTTAQTLNSPDTPGGGGAFISGLATSGAGAVADTAAFLKQQSCG